MSLVINTVEKSQIEGVEIVLLEQIEDERGAILHMMRSDSPVFSGFGEVYFSTVNPGMVKGWKRHHERMQHFVIPVGKVRLVIYDDRPYSASLGVLETRFMGRPDQYYMICIPKMLWYGWQAISDTPALLANFIDKPFDPAEQEVMPIDSKHIPYTWQVSNE